MASETSRTATILTEQGPSVPMEVDSAEKQQLAPLPVTTRHMHGLPFPGTLVGGVHNVVHHELTNLPKASLRNLCDEFHLPVTGNMAKLRERLQEFSANRKEWENLVPGARIKHRGKRDGGIAKAKKKTTTTTTKQSARRRELLFSSSTEHAGNGSGVKHALPTERSKDTRTNEERAELLAWASRCVARNPYRGPKPVQDPPSCSTPPLAQHGTVDIDTSSAGPSSRAQHHDNTLLEQLKQTQTNLAALTDIIAHGGGAVALLVQGAPTHPGSSLVTRDSVTSSGGPPDEDMAVDVPAASAAAPLAPCAQRDGDGCLKLGNGTMLFFSKASIPDPPAVSFAKNIPRLVQLWDDASMDWDPSDAVLHVQGKPIALKHWPELYHYGKASQWAGTKKNWAHWRDIVWCWPNLSEEGFWAKFSANGSQMSFTAILKQLKEERVAADHQLAEEAREKYGGNFGLMFEYRRGGTHHVRDKESAIAKHYRDLQK